ncbi:MAG: rod-binding protein [Thermoanaerobacteraceae bacterium]|nr:rod-binding protein [Thermoanaerobacteraceae bacterium]
MINPINGLLVIDSANVKSSADKTVSFETMLKEAVDKKDDELLKKACQDFESILVSMVLKNMRATVPKDSLYGNSIGIDIFTSMLDDEYAKEISQSGGFGLADMLYKSFLIKL